VTTRLVMATQKKEIWLYVLVAITVIEKAVIGM
jgi:hypothetical protein